MTHHICCFTGQVQHLLVAQITPPSAVTLLSHASAAAHTCNVLPVMPHLIAVPGALQHAQNITDVDILNFALNLEYLEASFYNWCVIFKLLIRPNFGVTTLITRSVHVVGTACLIRCTAASSMWMSCGGAALNASSPTP